MGVDVKNYPVLGGNATMLNAYINITDINIFKNETGHGVTYKINIYKTQDSTIILLSDIRVIHFGETPVTENGWKLSYDNFKQELTSASISFIDVM
tara:strand:+ start:1113 stop:1400 length:288 start_codon:yes stop_codon:yes gene_type:complete